MKSRTYTFNNSTLKIVFGNILDSKADVIVSSDDNCISMGGGVSRAIKIAGGGQIQDDACKMLPASVGDVVVSTAGKLPQKYIFHCLTIDYSLKGLISNLTSQDMNHYILQHSVDKCFRLIQALELDSIAFPCIGAGVAGIPLVQVAEVMADVVANNLNQTQRALEVELYLFDRFQQLKDMDYIDIFEHFAIKSALLRHEEESKSTRTTTTSLPELKSTELNHDVFISYSHKDKEVMLHIKNLLEQHGIRTWVDTEGVYSSGNFKKYVAVAIEKTKAVLFLSSMESNASRYVEKEVSYAIQLEKPVIPIHLDEAPYNASLRMDLSNINHLTFEDSEEFEQQLLLQIAFELKKF